MNSNDKFHQQWEYRRKEVDGDTSSDDDQSNTNTVKKRSLVADLALLDNDEPNDNLECQRHDKRALEADDRKTKSSKKNNKRMRNLIKNEEMVVLKDIKIFADSLIQELIVFRENMISHMKEEMRKLATCRSRNEPIVKNARECSRKMKSSRQENVVGSNACKFPKALAETVKNNWNFEATVKNEQLTKGDDRLRVSEMADSNLANGSDQVVASSSYSTLPTIIPKPLLQNQRNHLMPLSDRIEIPPRVPKSVSYSGTRDTGTLTDDDKIIYYYPHLTDVRAGEQFGKSSHISHQKSVGLVGQKYCPQMAGAAYPVPLTNSHGRDNGSNILSSTYCESSLASPRMNGVVRFPTWNATSCIALLDQDFSYGVNRNMGS
ncbi:hypothetical protein OROHE_024613 [Orobanche hederae]